MLVNVMMMMMKMMQRMMINNGRRIDWLILVYLCQRAQKIVLVNELNVDWPPHEKIVLNFLCLYNRNSIYKSFCTL